MALEALFLPHFGIDNKHVFQQTKRPFNIKCCHVVQDGDSLAVIATMLDQRGRVSVKVTELKRRATDAMVAYGRMRAQDLSSDATADTAAHIVRLRQPERGFAARSNGTGILSCLISTGVWFSVR